MTRLRPLPVSTSTIRVATIFPIVFDFPLVRKGIATKRDVASEVDFDDINSKKSAHVGYFSVIALPTLSLTPGMCCNIFCHVSFAPFPDLTESPNVRPSDDDVRTLEIRVMINAKDNTIALGKMQFAV